MDVAVIEVAIAIWMVRIYRQYGAWGLGRKGAGIDGNV